VSGRRLTAVKVLLMLPWAAPELVHDLRRYAEPHGIEFDEELLRM
jgi:hypothetical protein